MSYSTPGIRIQDASDALDSASEAEDARPARERATSTIVALAGITLVVVTVLVTVAGFGISLVRLATGSMTPTYPTDSVLLVRSVPAASVQVGDVVTVSRDGLVPITHRVVEVEPIGTRGGAELVLQGDANDVVDPEPYQVSRVGLVVVGIPFGGGLLQAVQSPLGLGLATVLVCSLVLWAWWPRRERGAHVKETS